MHPGYPGGYAVSMYTGMGPYQAMMPQAAAPYPTSPVLNPALAASPSAGFSVPSSSNSSRQTSLSEPMPRPAREKRTSASYLLLHCSPRSRQASTGPPARCLPSS